MIIFNKCFGSPKIQAANLHILVSFPTHVEERIGIHVKVNTFDPVDPIVVGSHDLVGGQSMPARTWGVPPEISQSSSDMTGMIIAYVKPNQHPFVSADPPLWQMRGRRLGRGEASSLVCW